MLIEWDSRSNHERPGDRGRQFDTILGGKCFSVTLIARGQKASGKIPQIAIIPIEAEDLGYVAAIPGGFLAKPRRLYWHTATLLAGMNDQIGIGGGILLDLQILGPYNTGNYMGQERKT